MAWACCAVMIKKPALHEHNVCTMQTGPAAIEAVDNFFRNTWNAQRTQPLRFTSDALAPAAIPLPQMPSLLRTLMVPGTMPQVLQHQHGFGDTGRRNQCS
jgi:hypothetical protein